METPTGLRLPELAHHSSSFSFCVCVVSHQSNNKVKHREQSDSNVSLNHTSVIECVQSAAVRVHGMSLSLFFRVLSPSPPWCWSWVTVLPAGAAGSTPAGRMWGNCLPFILGLTFSLFSPSVIQTIGIRCPEEPCSNWWSRWLFLWGWTYMNSSLLQYFKVSSSISCSFLCKEILSKPNGRMNLLTYQTRFSIRLPPSPTCTKGCAVFPLVSFCTFRHAWTLGSDIAAALWIDKQELAFIYHSRMHFLRRRRAERSYLWPRSAKCISLFFFAVQTFCPTTWKW